VQTILSDLFYDAATGQAREAVLPRADAYDLPEGAGTDLPEALDRLEAERAAAEEV
jgi:hypothetical protein